MGGIAGAFDSRLMGRGWVAMGRDGNVKDAKKRRDLSPKARWCAQSLLVLTSSKGCYFRGTAPAKPRNVRSMFVN